MLTGEQIRAAIGALRWSQAVLSEKSGIPARTIQRVTEAEGLPSTQAATLVAIKEAFEAAGVSFVEGDGLAGVMVAPVPIPPKRMAKPKAKAGAQ